MSHKEILQNRVDRIVKTLKDKILNQGFSTWDELKSEYRDLVTKGIISDFEIYSTATDRTRSYFLKYKLPVNLGSEWKITKLLSWRI